MPSQNQTKVPVGTILEGKFRITREIGRGGMAAVYEAENIDIGKRVAVKILAAELITSRVVRERFIREARAAAAVRSPYICDVYDSGMFEERPFLVMELLEGESLYDLLTRVRQIDIETTLRVATHTARGLAKAHEANVVHRDLKPENIFLTTDEEGKLVAKLVDFGLAKFYEPSNGDTAAVRLTREGALFGTPAYMSPEQAKGRGEVDHRADLWALGCIVYECLTGQTVWNVDQGVAMILAQIASAPLPKPSKLRPDLPPAFEEWFHKALERDVNRRFQTARELADSLAKALAPSVEGPHSSFSLASQHDNQVVDELMASSDRSLTTSLPVPESPKPEPPARPAVNEPAVPIHSTKPPPEPASTRAISVLMVLAALCLGAYAIWLYVLHPPSVQGPSAALLTEKKTDTKKKNDRGTRADGEPLEAEDYAVRIAEAQELLAAGEGQRALEALKAALANGGAPAARSLLAHATIAVEEGSKGACKVTGLTRPRPYEIDEPTSRPAIAATSKGVVVAWVDNHQDPRRRQAYTVLLDSAMRRISPAIAVTPEAAGARQPRLLTTKDKLILTYWDDTGNEPGVYVRFLTHEGKIASPARRLSDKKKGELFPALAPAGDGRFWAVWEEEIEKGTIDLVARELSPELEPLGPPVRLTAIVAGKGAAVAPSMPDLAVAHGSLNVAFSVHRGNDRYQVTLLRVPLNDPELKTGLPPVTKNARGKDRVIGTLLPLSRPIGKNRSARIACIKEGCFTVWDDEKGGAFAAFVERDKTQPLWHREFATKGTRPSLASGPDGAVVAWYEEARIRFAAISRDGLGPPSILNRLSGFQPEPDIAPGGKPGQWYISWRDYESAHLEIFALRAQCQ